jgi:predicted amidophosphoribosyltransferase
MAGKFVPGSTKPLIVLQKLTEVRFLCQRYFLQTRKLASTNDDTVAMNPASVFHLIRKKSLRPLLDALYPPQCYVCARGLALHGLCSSCRLPPISADLGRRCERCYLPLDSDSGGSSQLSSCCTLCLQAPLLPQRLRFAWWYERQVREFMRCLKYRQHARLLPLLSSSIANALGELYPGERWDVVIAIPPSFRSRYSRLFSVPFALASAITKHPHHRNTPLALNGLRFRRPHRAQVGLSPQQRLSNMRHAFAARAKLVHEKHVLLVEDVLTTGATVSAATEALFDAGAAHVDVICVACSRQWEESRRKQILKRSISGRTINVALPD